MTLPQNDKQRKKEICMKTVNKFLCLLIIVTAAYYVTVVNDLTIKGFKLEKLKDKKEELQQENKKISLEAMSQQSYNNLARKASDLGMVSADNIDYVTARGGMMAKK